MRAERGNVAADSDVREDYSPRTSERARRHEGERRDRHLHVIGPDPTTWSPRSRGRLLFRYLLLSDLAATFVAFALAETYLLVSGAAVTPWRLLHYAGIATVLTALMAAHGLYRRNELRADHTTPDDMREMLGVVTLTAFAAVLVMWIIDPALEDVGAVFVGWFAALMTLPVGRAVARAVVRRRPGYEEKTLIVGAGALGQRLAVKLRQHPEYGLEVVGFADGRPDTPSSRMGLPVLGSP